MPARKLTHAATTKAATTINPAEFVEPFCAFLSAAHPALVNAESIDDAAESLIAVDPRLGELAAHATRELADRIDATVRAAGPGGYAIAIRRAELSNLDDVVITVAQAMVSEPTRQAQTDAEAALAQAVKQVETAKADLAAAIQSGDADAMRRARDVIDLSGPNAVDRARDAVQQAHGDAAQEAERIAAELTAPLTKATAQAKVAADNAKAEAERKQADYEALRAVSAIADAACAHLGRLSVEARARLADTAAEAERGRQARLGRMIGEES